MPAIVNRVIRPTTHKGYNSYRVKFENKDLSEGLLVSITHEEKPFRRIFRFSPDDLTPYKSIHFKVVGQDGEIEIKWVQPIPFSLVEASD